MPIVLLLAAVVVALIVGYAIGRARRPGSAALSPFPHELPPESAAPLPEALPRAGIAPALPAADSMAQVSSHPTPVAAPSMESVAGSAVGSAPDTAADRTSAERARIIRSGEAEAAMLRRAIVSREASITQLAGFAAERRRLFADLAAARGETARYRQFVVDLENNAPPPLFGTGAPDDLKLIVGVGPVLERMLHQLGVATYRQIAQWSDRDIDEFDAKLPEFPGRIRRDAWVTQARALHQSKYGEALPARGR